MAVDPHVQSVIRSGSMGAVKALPTELMTQCLGHASYSRWGETEVSIRSASPSVRPVADVPTASIDKATHGTREALYFVCCPECPDSPYGKTYERDDPQPVKCNPLTSILRPTPENCDADCDATQELCAADHLSAPSVPECDRNAQGSLTCDDDSGFRVHPGHLSASRDIALLQFGTRRSVVRIHSPRPF
jgi:hypothetical protein